MSDILRLFFAILLLTICLAAYFLVINALFIERVARSKAMIQSMPWRSLGVGLVNFVFFAVIAIILFSVGGNIGGLVGGILSVPGLFITALLAVLLSLGLAAMANILGERIFSHSSAWKQSIFGTACLSLACAVPFVGWFLLLPFIGFISIGAVILGFFQRKKA